MHVALQHVQFWVLLGCIHHEHIKKRVHLLSVCLARHVWLADTQS